MTTWTPTGATAAAYIPLITNSQDLQFDASGDALQFDSLGDTLMMGVNLTSWTAPTAANTVWTAV